MEFSDEYLINTETMGLLPMDGPYGESWSIVLEVDAILCVKKKILEIIDDSCIWFGSSYEGRKAGVTTLMGYKSMQPILVSSYIGQYFFPLGSSTARETVWLSHNHIKQYEKTDKETTRIQFSNSQTLGLPLRFGAFERKACRTAEYRHRINEHVQTYKVSRQEIQKNDFNDLSRWLAQTSSGTYSLNCKSSGYQSDGNESRA